MDHLSAIVPLPATEAGVLPTTVSQHLPVLRRCADPRDPLLLVAACLRLDQPGRGEHVLLLTRSRLVVTWRSRLTGRVLLHLNAGLRELTNVAWTSEPGQSTVEFAATAGDGLRERFRLNLTDQVQARRVELLFGEVFSPRLRLARPAVRHTRVSARHCG